MWVWSQTVQIQTPAPPSTSCATLDKVLNLSELWFLICEMETVIALCPMLDMSVKGVKTYKSLRTVSGAE